MPSLETMLVEFDKGYAKHEDPPKTSKFMSSIAEINEEYDRKKRGDSITVAKFPKTNHIIDWPKTLELIGIVAILLAIVLTVGVIFVKTKNKRKVLKIASIVLAVILFVGIIGYREYITQQKIENLTRKLESTQSELENTNDDYNSRMDDLEQENSSLKSQNDDLENEVSDLQEKNDNKSSYYVPTYDTSIDKFLEEQKAERQRKYQEDMNDYLEKKSDDDPYNDPMFKPIKPLDYP